MFKARGLGSSKGAPSGWKLQGVGRLALAGALAFAATPAAADTIYVGASAVQCDATTLAQALTLAQASASADEIRLTRTLTYTSVNLFLSDWDAAVRGDLIVSGGWDDCLDATPTSRILLNGSAGGVVVEVAESGASSDPMHLTLRDLGLTGANTGVAVAGPAVVRLERSWAFGNEHGGAASAGALLEIDASSVVRANASVTPGGLYGAGLICIGPDTRISVAGTVQDNWVEEGFPSAGGGLYLIDLCLAVLEPGAVIERNSAAVGGGAYVASGSRLEGGGAGMLGARISQNAATAGGGLHVWGSNSVAALHNVRIESNQAREGAGVYVESGALVELSRTADRNCAGAPRCLTLSHNILFDDAESEGFGSAAFVLNGGEFRMSQGFIEGNGGFGDAGWLILAYTQDNVLELEGVQIWDNRTREVFQLASLSELTAGFLTVAANTYWDESSMSYLESVPAHAANGSTIRLFTSIFVDHPAFVESGANAEIHVDCLILDTTAGTTSAGANMLGFDPRFRNAAIGDLSLLPDSPAIDGCDTFLYTPAFADYHLDARGYDSPTRPNVLGPFDRGADESPLLFASGFETGTLTGWSSTQP